jgi:hypothetical protein
VTSVPQSGLGPTATSTSTVATSAGFVLALPPTTTVPMGSISFAAPTAPGAANSTFTLTVQPALPSTVPALAVARKRTVAAIGAGGESETLDASILMTSSIALTFTTAPAFTVTLPASEIAAGGPFELAYYDPTAQAWDYTWEGPGTVSGTTVTFASNGAPFTLSAGVTAVFAVLGGFAPAPSPSPAASPASSPSPAASPTPGAVALSATTLSFTAVGAPYAQSVTATQTDSSGTFTETAGATPCTGIATIAQTGATFTVTPVAVGTCSYKITGTNAASASLNVTVTTTNVGGS